MNDRMKKALSVILCLALILGSGPLSGLGRLFNSYLPVHAQVYDSLTYEIRDGSAIITDCDDSVQGAVTVPQTLGGCPVTGIDPAAFCRCEQITKIIISAPVASIGDYAFSGCSSLTEISVPSTLKTVGDYAFSGCKSLVSADLPDGMESIGAYAFENCVSLTGFVLPEGISAVMEGTFFNCSAMVYAQISSGVTAIGKQAFYRCVSLCDLLIPEGLKAIGESAFGECLSLFGIYLPDSLAYIGGNAFKNCRSLTSMTLPDDVDTIGAYTFEDCVNLVGISFSDDLSDIGEGAFKNCLSLTGISLPDGLSVISKSAFEGCESLSSITIPSGVTDIGDYAFYKCASLPGISLPNGLSTLGTQAFAGCVGLADVTLPASLNVYGAGAFAGCTGISAFTISSGNQKYTVDNGVIYSVSGANLIQYPAGKTDVGFTFPGSVTGIRDYAFYGSKYLQSVTMTNNIKYIGVSSFADCKRLISASLSTKLLTVNYMAFNGCDRLVSINIPNITSVYNYAFGYCGSLNAVYVGMSYPSNIYENAFYGDTIDHAFFSAASGTSKVPATTVHTSAAASDLTLVSSTAPTTGSNGTYTYHCSKCGEDINLTVPAFDGDITVSFNSAGGSSVPSKTVTANSYFGSLPIPQKQNCVFAGWYTQQSGGERKTAGSTVDSTGNMTLYAHWLPKTITASFESPDTPCAYEKKVIKRTGTFGILPELEKPGYTFAGWYTDPENGYRITDTSEITTASDFTLYAQWAGAEGRVYFDNNYDSIKVNLLEIVNKSLSQGSLSYTYDDESGIAAINGTSSSTAVTLSDMPLTVSEGETYTISAEVVSGSLTGGYLVVECYDRAAQSQRINLDIASSRQATYTMTAAQASAVNRISVWVWANLTNNDHVEFNDFRVRLKLEKSSVQTAAATAYSPNRRTVMNGEAFGALPVPTERHGYTFDGWYTAPDGGELITAETTAAVPGEQTLYAHWSPVQNDVFFDVNHDGIGVNLFTPDIGTKTVDGMTCTFDAETDILTFNGSYTEDTILSTKPFRMKEGDVYAVSYEYISGSYAGGVLTFEAMDNADNSRLYLDLRNYSNSTIWNVSKQREQNVYCVRLRGWHSSSADVTTFNNFKIRLKFEKITNGTQAPTEYTPTVLKAGYLQNYPVMPIPSRAGYHFDGWFTSAQGGTRITEDTVCREVSGITLYAHWSTGKYYTCFDLNYGSIRPNIFGLKDSSGTSNGISIDYDRDSGILTYNGTAQSTAMVFRQPVPVTKGEKLLLTGTYESGSLTGGIPYVEMYFSSVDYSQVLKFNLPKSGSASAIWEIPKTGTFDLNVNFYGTGQTANNYKVKLKIERVDSADAAPTAYSPTAAYTEYSQPIGALPSPVRSGLHFDGWYTQPVGGEMVSESYTVTSSGTLYAHWSGPVLQSSIARIDYNSNRIFGIARGLTSLDGIFTLAQSGCSTEYVSISPTVKTGSKVNVIRDGKVYESYTVVIAGDVNGDGRVDGEDSVVADCIAQSMQPDCPDEMRLAADFDGNGTVDTADTALLRQAGLFLD